MWRDRALNLLAIGDQNLQGIADEIGYASVDELIGNIRSLVYAGLICTNGDLYSLTEAGQRYIEDHFIDKPTVADE